MNYELVKQLKEAGFRTEELELRWDEHDHDLLKADWEMYKEIYSPSLEELIEACGDDFLTLIKVDNGWMSHASRYKGTSRAFVNYMLGSTPSEAVAKLWLALNSPLSN